MRSLYMESKNINHDNYFKLDNYKRRNEKRKILNDQEPLLFYWRITNKND